MKAHVTRFLIATTGALATILVTTPAGASGPPPGDDDDAAVVLVGQLHQGQEAAAWRLVDGGVSDVDIGEASVGPETELLLVTVSLLDGPMPSTREALGALEGTTLPRVAVVLTNGLFMTDAELRQLVLFETSELLTSFGLPADDLPVLDADDPGFADQVAALLDEPPADYPVTPSATVGG